jgi:hypothetical protein
MVNISTSIFGALKAAPPPNPTWRYAYELILGAAASLLSAHPQYEGTVHYGHKREYESRPELLPEIFEKAYEETVGKEQVFNLYFDGLKAWTAGYYFNSAIVRIACAYEYTLCTAGDKDPYDGVKFKAVSDYLKGKHPPPSLEQQLEVISLLSDRNYKREKLDEKVSKCIEDLIDKECLTQERSVESIYEQLSNNDEFFKSSFLYVWNDYNWFKHRPMGYGIPSHARQDARVQFALALRAFLGLCDFYSWCRQKAKTESGTSG